MEQYVILANVVGPEVQNVQELASVWGDVGRDLEAVGCDLLDAHALLGASDFLVRFEAEDREAALQASIALERYGLDAETMGAIPVERFGELVDDG